MEETADKPKWLLELENRKRKPRLAHEAGAGAACLICNAACPGLDLHFWRKICKNCKCSRDDHDVNDDDFPQFDLLFGPTGKFKKKAILLQVPNKKQQEAETAFEWVPPDTTKELATDYMNALPKDKLPIKGSAGAALRRQLLQKQLPLHDIDQKACNNLSDEEKKQFGKYLENLKKCVGQGKVTKILGARPFNRALMTPANATDMHRSSPQQKSISTPVTHLRTPSSFTPKISQTLHSKIPYNSDNEQNTNSHENTVQNTNTQNPECHNGVLSAISNNSGVANSEQLQQGTYPNPQYSSVIGPARKPNQFSTNYEQTGINAGNYQANSLTHPNDSQSENAASINYPVVRTVPHSQVACSEKCSCQVPSESAMLDTKRGTCLSCLNNSNATQFSSSNTNTPQDVRAQHYKDSLTAPLSSLVHSENLNSDDALAAEAMLANALLPPSAIHSNDIIGSTLDEKGLTYIREKLSNKYSMQENQVPSVANPSEADNLLKKRTVPTKQGNDVSNDKEIQRENIIAAMKNPSGFSTIMRDKVPQMGVTESEVKPMTPNKPLYGLPKGDHCHSEENGNLGQVAHAIPTTILPTGPYQSNGATPNSNTVQVPSMRGQSETIHNQDNQNIQCSLPQTDIPAHLMNTNCLQSELNTSGPIQSNVIHSESLQNQVFPHEAVGTASLVTQTPPNLNSMMEGLDISPKKVQKCHECQGEIRVGDVAVIAEKAKNEAWHPGCFACSVCNELLVDLVYFYYKGKLYCGRDLATFLGIPRCFACDELIFVREYTVAEGHNYHVEHFCCWDCDVPLAGQKYISENDRPLCLVCYQKTYAETCNACNVVIAADQQGVAIKNLNFHATEECFCCVICKKNLLNSRMAVKEGKLFCSKECISTFGNQNMSST